MRVAKGKGLSVSGHLPSAAKLAHSSYALGSLERDIYVLAQCADAGKTFDGKTAQSLHGWQPSTRISAFYCRVILSKRTLHIYEKAEIDGALAYAAEQA